MTSADTAGTVVRQANARACLLTLRESGRALTVAEIAASTGLSRPTVTSVVTSLLEGGALREVETARAAAPGRPARHLTFEPAVGTVAAVDLGARSVRCLLADAAGTVLADLRRDLEAVDADGHWETVVEVVDAAVAQASRGRNAELPRPAAVGLAVPGILTADGAIAQSLALESLVGTSPDQELFTRLGCPVVVENDIKLAALAEHHLAGPDEGTDIAFVQIGHRISVALIVGGKILQGRHRLAGELGTQRGMRWTGSSLRGRLQWSTGDEAVTLFDRAANGDSEAAAEIDAFCAEIAPRIASLVLTVDPEQVVIGGGLSRAGNTLLEPLRRHVHHLLTAPDRPTLTAARLSTDGALIGALGLAFEHASVQVTGVTDVPPPWHRFAAPRTDPHPEGTP